MGGAEHSKMHESYPGSSVNSHGAQRALLFCISRITPKTVLPAGIGRDLLRQ